MPFLFILYSRIFILEVCHFFEGLGEDHQGLFFLDSLMAFVHEFFGCGNRILHVNYVSVTYYEWFENQKFFSCQVAITDKSDILQNKKAILLQSFWQKRSSHIDPRMFYIFYPFLIVLWDIFEMIKCPLLIPQQFVIMPAFWLLWGRSQWLHKKVTEKPCQKIIKYQFC